MLNTLLAAGVLLCGGTASASHESNTLARHAQSLASLASCMEDEFRDDLRRMHRHYGPSRDERRFLESLCRLAGLTGQFRRAVESCVPACELERGFEAVEEAFECMVENSEEVRVCSSLRSMMQRFEETLECLEDTDFEAVSRRGAHGHHHGHGHLEGSNTGGIQFRIPFPQGLPFVFRQPVR